jgi:hypothetical protein
MGRYDNTIFTGIVVLTLLLAGFLIYSEGSLPGYSRMTTGFGFELDFFIALATALIAGILFVVSIRSYRKDRRVRDLFVSGAFFLFTIEGCLFIVEALLKAEWFEPAAHVLNFGILLLFFAGLMRDLTLE